MGDAVHHHLDVVERRVVCVEKCIRVRDATGCALARLAVEFNRFDDRLKDLARHIRQAHEDVEKIQVTGGKITQQFLRIESAEVDELESMSPKVVELREENKGSK